MKDEHRYKQAQIKRQIELDKNQVKLIEVEDQNTKLLTDRIENQ